MRRLCFIALLLIAPRLQAGLGWGFQLGLAGTQFDLKAHPSSGSSSTNLFALLAASNPVLPQADMSGGLGLNLHADYARILEAQVELNWVEHNAKTIQDLGNGTKSVVQYSRDSSEGDLLLRLGYPFGFGPGWVLRPFGSVGTFGNRTLAAKRRSGLEGDSNVKETAWDGVPNEDWGFIMGGGFDFQIKGQAPRIGLEFRYLSGQKDLDPQGTSEVKDRTYLGMLSFGF